MSLDTDFGPLLPPQKRDPSLPAWKPWETTAPASKTVLDATSAPQLAQFTMAVMENWALGQACVRDLLILWVIDEEGRFTYAWEELVVEGKPQQVPRHNRLELTHRCDKLGHPSLVGCGEARIAGELYLDETGSSVAWVLNNKSGRYGLHPTRTPHHLRRVADMLRDAGVPVVEHFLHG